MAAEMAIAAQRPAGHRRAAGVLTDGTAFYAPIGEVIVDGSRVVCHLCGRSLRSVAAHLTAHGWTKAEYCEAFGLERRQSLEGPETRKLRAAALTSRLVFDPAIREGSAAGRDRARSGDLARDAAGRPAARRFPGSAGPRPPGPSPWCRPPSWPGPTGSEPTSTWPRSPPGRPGGSATPT